MNIKFKVIIEPRTIDGGFGPSKCDKCGGKTTAYLEIYYYIDPKLTVRIVLCGGCLDDGINIINDAMIKSCINANSRGNR